MCILYNIYVCIPKKQNFFHADTGLFLPVYRRIYGHMVLAVLKKRLLYPDPPKFRFGVGGVVGVKNVIEKNPEEIAFLMLETPVKHYHVIDIEEKQKLEQIARSIVKKLALLELLGYRIEFSINSHRVFTLKIAKRDTDMNYIIYMKLWDPKTKAKAIMLGGWITVKEKWYWGQYIVIDLSYSKNVEEKQLFEFVKKLIQLVI